MRAVRRARALALGVALGCSGGGGPGGPDGGPPASDADPRAPDAGPGVTRGGLVRLVDHSLEDDHGRFVALGATMFWAPWGYKHDRPRLEAELAFLRDHGFHFIRALGIVGDPDGPDSWDGREIDLGWPDYDEVIAGLTDLAWDGYGLRVEWTLIGDGQHQVPAQADRLALADRFLAMAAPRQEKILHLEVANEFYQNGFDGPDGVDDLREVSAYLRERTELLVAASAPYSADCGDVEAVYGGGVADLATMHFDRSNGGVEGDWEPMRQPWGYEACTAPGLPPASNNEPVGPGSSVTSVNEVAPIVAAPLVTWIASLPIHVFHSGAGVRGFESFAAMSGADAQRHVARLVPGDVASWARHACGEGDAPFRCYARDGGTWVADAAWPELGDPTGGAVGVYAATSGADFVAVAIGVRGELLLEARRALAVEVIDPITAEVVAAHAPDAGETFVVGDGRELLLLRGTSR